MSDFAKLFDTPHGQILVTKEFDDGYKITVRGRQFGGADPAVTAEYDSKEDREDAFIKIDQTVADKQAEAFAKMMAELFQDDKP